MVKELDVIDRSLLRLSQLFDDRIDFYDYDIIENEDFDGQIEIDNQQLVFFLLSNPTISKINHIIGQVGKSKSFLLIFEGVSRKTIDYCVANKINFIDSDGSCYIALPNLKVWLSSDKNDKTKSLKSRAFQKSGLILLFEIFRNPYFLTLNYRELSKLSGISLASINSVFDDLKERGYLIENESGDKWLANCKQLVLKWSYNYNENLRPAFHRGFFTCLNRNKLDQLLEKNHDKLPFKVGGAKGLSLLNKYIKSDDLVLYSSIKLSQFARDFGILPSKEIDTNSIQIIEPFWNFNEDDENKTVDEILIFADLLNSKDYRIIESAENLLNNEIRNRFLQHKFLW